MFPGARGLDEDDQHTRHDPLRVADPFAAHSTFPIAHRHETARDGFSEQNRSCELADIRLCAKRLPRRGNQGSERTAGLSPGQVCGRGFRFGQSSLEAGAGSSLHDCPLSDKPAGRIKAAAEGHPGLIGRQGCLTRFGRV